MISGVSLSNQSHYPVAFIVLANSLKKCYDSGSYILVINSLSITVCLGLACFIILVDKSRASLLIQNSLITPVEF